MTTITATYRNRATDETYKLIGVKSLAHAWRLAWWVAARTGWNLSTFHHDVAVTIGR